MKHNYLKHLFTALLMLCATAAVSKNFEIGGICYSILSEENKTLKVTHFELFNSTKKYTGEVVIPETVTVGSSYFNDMISTNKESSSTWTGGLHFSGVGKFAFDWFVSSESGYDWLVVTIDDKEVLRKSGEESGHYEITIKEEGVHSVGVEYIKDYSVSKGKDCGGIYNVVFGRTITTYNVSCIDSYAFIDCSGLTSITIPNSVTSIRNSAFSGCSGLTSITIPKSVTEIQHDVFYDCKRLTSITSLIPADNLFVPGSDAFLGVDKTNCTLYVPYGAKETYAATEGWEDIENIVKMQYNSLSLLKKIKIKMVYGL